jgi:drug/metabolite transporter (DMT)-like permease
MIWALLIQQFLASTTHIVAKNLTSEMQPAAILFFRAEIASIVFASIVALRRGSIKRIAKKDILTLFILGIINIPINQFLFFTAISLTTAPNVALAYALSPVFVFGIAAIFFKEKVSPLKIVGIITAISGTIMILSERGIGFHSQYFVGNILALTASISWAFYTVLGKNFTMKYGAIYSNSLTSIIGFFVFIPIFFILPESKSMVEPSVINWFQVFYLAIISSVVSYILWYWALKRADASKVSVFNNIQPILTTVLAVLFFGQELTLIFIIGGLITLAGVLLTQKG